MKSRIASRLAFALTLSAAAVSFSFRLDARDVYRNFLDPGIPHHRAILDTLSLLEKTPNDAGLHNDLGCLIARDGFWRDALREFSTAADLDKRDSRPLFNAGLVHAWKGEWSSARGAFRKTIKRDGGNWPGWWMLGYAEERLGNVNAAVDAYKTSLRVDTSLYDVKKNPFAVDTRLKGRVLMETLDKRLVRAAMPGAEQLADAERVGSFFQKGRTAAPAAFVPREEPVLAPGPQGPVITSVPPSRPASSVPMRPVPPRGARETIPEAPRGAAPGGAETDTAEPGTTAAPPSTVPVPMPGPGGS